MHTASFLSFPEKDTKFALFLFFSLLFLSAAVFVFAGEPTSTQNIFQDSDQDGLSNDEEKLYGTDPSDKDSDDDGYGDGVEVESGYDPLRRAPGDKIIKEAEAPLVITQEASENLTQKVSGEIVNILKDTDESDKAVSLEDINDSVTKMLSESTEEEITLPEVDIEDIKIKKLSKSLKEKDRDEQERKDAIGYLTVIAYLTANNMPRTFQTKDEFNGILRGVSGNFITSLSSGNMEYINQLSEQGEKMLGELKEVEVPEKMLDVHVKALKMAKYAMQLKEELRPSQNERDPLGQIAVLSKIQGLIGSAIGLIDEVQQKLVDYGVEEIPLNL